jgi:hypothetical protein
MIPALNRWGDSLAVRGACALFLAVSVFSVFWPMGNPWQHPWLYVLMERRGWIDYRTPGEQFEFPHPLTTWFPSLPPLAGPGEEPASIEFDVYDGDAHPRRLALSDAGNEERDGRKFRRVVASWSGGPGHETETIYLIDQEAFERGEAAAKILYLSGDPPASERVEAEAFLQGLPTSRPYQPGEIRYLRTPLRPEAFQCRRAASRVHVAKSSDGGHWYRTDLWLNSDVPFGVVRRESSIFDDAGTLLSRTTYAAVKASKVDTATIPRADAEQKR